MTPTENTSPLSVYGCNLNISGGIYPGVPAFDTSSFSFIGSAKPKSTNLISN